jgi:hypothetical protein
MKRLVDKHLQAWADDSDRKSLLLRGARQVGKTYSCRKLGKGFDEFVAINTGFRPFYSQCQLLTVARPRSTRLKALSIWNRS